MKSQSHGAGAALDHERAVTARYGRSARAREAELCCPVEYESRYLDILPEEILAKDYGCGDPTRYVREGDTVLDLGSGAGKICYMLAQKVGAGGRVIGVDMNDDMLAVARRHQPGIAGKLGYDNVRFAKGRIQDLALDLEALDAHLATAPVASASDLAALDAELARRRAEEPLIATDSVDVVVSNCVLNLVRPADKRQLFREIFRVLRPGGRAVISDIVSDEDIPEHMAADPELWSGCISGAFREDTFLEMFTDAGFYGAEILARGSDPWRTVEGIEFRSMTVRAWKGKEGPCLERNQAVVYHGPWRRVMDDDGHTFPRGERVAICDKTYRILTNPDGPYASYFSGIEPYESIDPADAKPFACTGLTRRPPRTTKGARYERNTSASESCCGPDGCC